MAFFRGSIPTEAPIYRVPVEEITDRGYALVMDGDRVIPDAASATNCMTLRFRDGQVRVRREEEHHGIQEETIL